MKKEFDCHINDTTVQIFLCKDKDLSYGNASGLVAVEGDRKFVLTVAHVLPEGNCATILPVAFADLKIENGKSSMGMLPLGVCPVFANMHQMKLDGIPEENDPCLDFTFFEVPKHVTFKGFGVNSVVNVKEFSSFRSIDCNCVSSAERFSFHGAIKAEPFGLRFYDTEVLKWETRTVTGLKMVKVGNSYVRFEPDDLQQFVGVQMQGTSGSPILDANGMPIAIVVAGSEDDGYVIGLRLDKAWNLLLNVANGLLSPKELSVEDYTRILGSSIYDNIRGYRSTKAD